MAFHPDLPDHHHPDHPQGGPRAHPRHHPHHPHPHPNPDPHPNPHPYPHPYHHHHQNHSGSGGDLSTMAENEPSSPSSSSPSSSPSPSPSRHGGAWGEARVPEGTKRRGRSGHGGHGRAAFLLVLLSVLGTIAPGRALCEDRCERVVPMLSHLRALWSRSFKRVGEKRVSFEEFMVSLVQASSNTGHSRAHRLGNALLNLIGQYQDCVMACEHPFSKRSADSSASRRPQPSLKRLCDRIYNKGYTLPLLEELCMTYGA